MSPVSVCMPYWNRPRELTRTINSYRRMYPDLELEISICDDGSFDPPPPFNGTKLTTLTKKVHSLNPCVPINVAVRQASHDVIVLTNPEVEHREPVLHQMLEALQGPDDYVMAACRNAADRRGLWAHGAEEWIAGEQAPRAPIGGRQPIPAGSDLHFCVMFHRELFERAGGFDEAYRYGLACDDNDWLWRLHAVGANFKRVPGVVWHYRTGHWPAGVADRKVALAKNVALLEKKWGHLLEYRSCAS